MTAPALAMDAPEVKGKTASDAPPDKKNIYGFYRWVVSRMESIDKAYRMGGDLLVFQELRDGKAVYVSHPFKWDGEMLVRGDLFHPGMMRIARIAEIMQQPGQARLLVSQQEKTDREEWARLKPIREALAPMVEDARSFLQEKLSAQGQLGRAEQAVKHWRGELEAAESNLKSKEKKIAEYISKLDI